MVIGLLLLLDATYNDWNEKWKSGSGWLNTGRNNRSREGERKENSTKFVWWHFKVRENRQTSSSKSLWYQSQIPKEDKHKKMRRI